MMILQKENINFDAHWTHAIGEHVQGEHKTDRSNDNTPRKLDCLHLQH